MARVVGRSVFVVKHYIAVIAKSVTLFGIPAKRSVALVGTFMVASRTKTARCSESSQVEAVLRARLFADQVDHPTFFHCSSSVFIQTDAVRKIGLCIYIYIYKDFTYICFSVFKGTQPLIKFSCRGVITSITSGLTSFFTGRILPFSGRNFPFLARIFPFLGRILPFSARFVPS